MRQKLQNIKNEALAMIMQTQDQAELDHIRIQYLGKSGQLAQIAKQLKSLDPAERIEVGKLFNDVKTAISQALQPKLSTEHWTLSTDVDPTLPGIPVSAGHLHPTTLVIREMNEIFKSLGFSVADGPEIESEEYNYNRTNLPPDHPARDLQDTIYLKKPDWLLRTHTSNVEARILATHQPPYRYVIPGKCFRNEKANASNNSVFYQYQGLAVGTDISLAQLKYTLNFFISRFYGPQRKSRFRCKYYPEVEPGVGVDIDCSFCSQKGCQVCKFRGWIEILGAGMVHPNMFRRVNLDPAKYSGFAWGMGLDRIVMDRTGITDIRSLYNGDITYIT